MSMDVDKLYNLLPAIYRIRDAEGGNALKAVLTSVVKQDLPLKALLSVIAEQVAVIEEDLAQLYDDQFIETCAEWVIPYIADSISYQPLQGATPQICHPRTDVANTLRYRKAKGTAYMLESLVQDVTGWYARVVEFFQLLSTTQHMSNVRLNRGQTVDMRQGSHLKLLNTPFDTLAHSIDTRCISSHQRPGRYNIPGLGIFVCRLKVYSLTNSPAFKVDEHRYLFSPLGQNMQLFNQPQAKNETTFFAEPINLPLPINRNVSSLDNYYGHDKSFALTLNGKLIETHQIVIADLSDTEDDTWRNIPQGHKIAIDPVLGRIAFATPPKGSVLVTYHYAFSTDMGGGEYERATSLTALKSTKFISQAHANIQDALDSLDGDGAIEITDSGRYIGQLHITAASDQQIELRAANKQRPILVPGEHEQPSEIVIDGKHGATVTLNGLLISGARVLVKGNIRRLILKHCTLVPGLALSRHGRPHHPNRSSLIVLSENTSIEIDHCILGAMRIARGARVSITDSIVDATSEKRVAYAAADTDDEESVLPGGRLHVENSTIIGRVYTEMLEEASNTIFLAQAEDEQVAPISVERCQDGCVRFCYLPLTSRVPNRYQCQPSTEANDRHIHPHFTSLRYGTPGYCQLSQHSAHEIWQGADNEAEMGVFNALFQPQREANLHVRLDEYLRFGLEAGIFDISQRVHEEIFDEGRF